MNQEQQTAARAVLTKYPGLKVAIKRGDSATTLTPFITSRPDLRGCPVDIVMNATPVASITRAMDRSCADLMQQVN